MKITNVLGLPEPLVAAARSEHVYTPRRYSVSELLRSPRETLLARRHDDEIVADAADMVWSVFGSAVHSIIQDADSTDDQQQEMKLVVDMPHGYAVSGIFDLYDRATGTVVDWKTASVWKGISGDYDDWYKQVTSYAWMLLQHGETPTCAEIVVLLKDHSMRKAETEPDYPQHPVQTLTWMLTRRAIAEAGQLITSALVALEELESTPDAALPLCTESSRWHKPDKWALMKTGRKTAVKLYDTETEATEAAVNDAKLYVQYRPGEDSKCLRYCAAREFCEHYRLIKTKED